MARLAAAALAGRQGDPGAAPVETLIVPGGQHSWLYEDRVYREVVARFLSTALGGPLDPDTAAERAAATPSQRIPDLEVQFAAMEETYGGLRTLAQVALPGATKRIREPTDPTTQSNATPAENAEAAQAAGAAGAVDAGAIDPVIAPVPTPPAP
jgi:hypothetical protein